MINQRRLKELLNYDPCSGIFTWKVSLRNFVRKGDVAGSTIRDTNRSLRYMRIWISGESYPSHRLAWLYIYGSFPTSPLDHIDGNSFNNRIENLRTVTASENSRNAKMYSTNTSGKVGVVWNKRDKRWRAQIMAERKHIHLGSFGTFEEAAKARSDAEIDLGFHPNHGLPR